MSLESVDSYLAEMRSQHLASLMDLLRIPSVSADEERRDDIETCAAWLKEHLEEIGAEHVQLLRTGGNPVVYGDWLHAHEGAPTVLVYGHYDVQPAEPLELWDSPPFEPSIRNDRIYARGVSDNKGQLYLYLKAFEAFLATRSSLPLNVKFLLEGEEELRADHLLQLVTEQSELLAADVAAVSDAGFFEADVPGLTTGLRGMAALNFSLRTANTDLHSGGFGGTVPNALHAMAALVSGLHSPEDGTVLVDGFYDDVKPISASLRDAWALLPFDPANYTSDIGVSVLFGESGYSPLERLWARPTLEVCGLWGGYQGAGVKTIVPCEAHAKISCRLVPDQDPYRVLDLVRKHLMQNVPPGARLTFDYELPGCYPVVTPTDSPALDSALSALRVVYGKEPVIFRNGASVPVVEIIQRVLKLESVLLGFSCPDESFHAPNEFMRLENFDKGPRTIARWWEDLGSR